MLTAVIENRVSISLEYQTIQTSTFFFIHFSIVKLNGSVAYQNIAGLSRFICRKTAIITSFTQQKIPFFFFFPQKQCDKTVCCISWWEVLHISSRARGEPWTSSPVVLLAWQVLVRFTFIFFFFFGEIHILLSQNQSSKTVASRLFAFGSAAGIVSAGNVRWENNMDVCVCVYLYWF